MVGLVLWTPAQARENAPKQFVSANVLGTSFEMHIDAPSTEAEQAHALVLAEIKRLEKIFSTYDKRSEISKINAQVQSASDTPSQDLLAVVELCEKWQSALPKSFSCRLGKVIDMWQDYELQQLRPERAKIRAQARAAQESDYSQADLISGKPNTEFTWSFGGIAKGYILDKAMTVAKASASNATAIKIDIGGDAVYWQAPQSTQAKWQVGLASPNKIDDSQQTRLGILSLTQGAVAYSGHESRARTIGRRDYSHILTPRDGWPAHNPVTAIVKGPDATSADALATALAASELSASLDWLSKHPEFSVLLIDKDGRQYASKNWYQHFKGAEQNAQNSVQPYQAHIRFVLPKLNVVEYRKPYVAIWVADKKGKVVRNLLVLGQSERWMEENRTWWRKQGRKAPQLLDGFARPTRRPGQYDIVWNGRDDFGNLLPQGKYKLFAEAAREHGGHEKLSIPFQLTDTPQDFSKQGHSEIGALTFKSTSGRERL